MGTMSKSIKSKAKQKPKANKKKTKARGQQYKDSVCTIGYQVPGLASFKKVKGDSQEIRARFGGKATGLIEMSKLGVAVPPAFNLSTDLCQVYLMRGKLPQTVVEQIEKAVHGLEVTAKKTFGGEIDPLLISVRSGARVSMPGMMDTVLNLGLNTRVVESLVTQDSSQARFWWDCYRRLIQMYADVVLGASTEPMEEALRQKREETHVETDAGLSADALKDLAFQFLSIVENENAVFPQDPWKQVFSAVEAVFRSWQSDRARHYREINQIPEEWGTSVTVQSMVFGNRNDESGTGVVFTRNPSTGGKTVYGEYLMNAQGEDVVAGIRTPKPISTLQSVNAKAFRRLTNDLQKLEKHFNDVQDVEFTIENGDLYILQTRNAKRTATASLEFAVQFVREKRWSKKQALQKVERSQVAQLLHPSLKATDQAPVCKGLPASPGAVSGIAAFNPETAVQFARAEQKVILIRRETSPEDIMGMSVAEGILTSTGGMTSHAAVVGRGMGKACVVGCSDLAVDEASKVATYDDTQIKEGDRLTIDGATGEVYLGELPTEAVSWGKSAKTFFKWADESATIPVLANADTAEQATTAIELGAQGIGLCRTEHMFFEPSRLRLLRKMILSEDSERVRQVLSETLSFQRDDFFSLFEAMRGKSVSVRLLDPPLHEFLPSLEDTAELDELAEELRLNKKDLEQKIQKIHEVNPMLGHRGCRLGVTFPEIYEMQIQALAQALAKAIKTKTKVELKIMIPLVMDPEELDFLLERLRTTYEESLGEALANDKKKVRKALSLSKWGTMIELPRAALLAGEIASDIDFISFGTNDLTQTTFGISRDDASKFLPLYKENGLLKEDPFSHLDKKGVGRLIEMAVTAARKANKKIEIGVCGEHGGDPASIPFFQKLKFHTVSCSPFRVPMARLAQAHHKVDGSPKKKKATNRKART